MAPGEATVKDRFTAVDTYALARELRGVIGGRLDKVFDAPPHGYAITFRRAGEGRSELVVSPGRFAALLDHAVPHSEELSPFARELRRILSGAQLTDVSDTGGERYLEFDLKRPDAEGGLRFAAELFGTGNVVVARGPTLVAVEHFRRWAHRTVRVGSDYSRPPSRSNPFHVSIVELESTLLASRTDRVSTLAARLQFGGPVAEELLVRAGLPGNVPAPTEAPEAAGRIHAAVLGLIQEIDAHSAGYLYSREGAALDVSPFASHRWRATEGVAESARPTFSAAAWEYFSGLPSLRPVIPSAIDTAVEELVRQLERQQSAVAALDERASELKGKAASILSNYALVEERLEHPPPDATDGVFEVDLDGRSVPLLVGRSARDAAQALFEEARRLEGKLSGAREAMRETDSKLATARAIRPAAEKVAPVASRARKAARWFEKYRWFFSSEGILVIGGRDAASNDLIVRRYLNPGDFYVHADVHGAPSVIVKHPDPGQPGPTEVTMREAAQFGVAFSKAWRAGHASANAFWVTPDQVSKAGASGEFVPRGAWVIHGTKNVFRDLPTELAIGLVQFDGEPLWCVSPPSALRARGEVRFLITPGEERDRPQREVELSRELGLPRDRLQSLLPAGGFIARRE